MAKKYDIRVCDVDANGQKKWHEESGIMAGSVQELTSLYKMCGQEIQILHEYQDDEAKNYGHQKKLDPNDVQMDHSKLSGGGLMRVNPDLPQYNPVEPVQQPTIQTVVKTQEPPRFFEIGGIKCKMENGKLYQKQWLRLSDEESSEFRIVSDKNNKICTLKDKHIEIMKWVLTEDSENKDLVKNNEKVLLNG